MLTLKKECAHWKPPKYSVVCSKHVPDEDYSVMFSDLTTVDFQRGLQKDVFGISISATCISTKSIPAESKGSKRKGRK